jgi:hypothetical protein
MVSPFAGSSLFLTTVGNHESDWIGSASLDYSDASGGECGVISTKLLPMPAPATTNQPWWSYDIGIIHFVGMSTEHNYTIGSPQYLWIEHDLASVNRSITPWIIFSGHRPMYVDSNSCCEGYDDDNCSNCAFGSDVSDMELLQENIEPLLYMYQVNLAFAGHFHNAERQSAIYQNKTIQKSSVTYDSLGNEVALFSNPNATVWMVIGSAGNGPSYALVNYSWSEKYWDNLFGYAFITAVNATYLSWELVNSANNEVVDRVAITQDFSAWSPQVADSTSSHQSIADDVLVIGFIVCMTGLIVAVIVHNLVFGRIMSTAAVSKDPNHDKQHLTKHVEVMNTV